MVEVFCFCLYELYVSDLFFFLKYFVNCCFVKIFIIFVKYNCLIWCNCVNRFSKNNFNCIIIDFFNGYC